MEFEWVEQKAHANFIKHRVSFEEAKSTFEDPFFLIFADAEHSLEERRFILLGESTKGKLLVVSFTQIGSATRLISARKAIRSERRFYEEEN
jgi:uncharacterized DUF497 family protein